jgi:dUTPase
MKIKVFEKTEGCFPQEFDNGEWFDLVTAKDIKLYAPAATALKYSTKKNPMTEEEKLKYKRNVVFQSTLIPLGVCMELPNGYEAPVIPRSSTFGKYGLIQTNSEGLIDCSYNSEKDEWKFPVIATRDVIIPKGTRLCQFRIQLSQKATALQKLKWLFSSSVELIKVDHLDNEPRGGFGEGTDKA